MDLTPATTGWVQECRDNSIILSHILLIYIFLLPSVTGLKTRQITPMQGPQKNHRHIIVTQKPAIRVGKTKNEIRLNFLGPEYFEKESYLMGENINNAHLTWITPGLLLDNWSDPYGLSKYELKAQLVLPL